MSTFSEQISSNKAVIRFDVVGGPERTAVAEDMSFLNYRLGSVEVSHEITKEQPDIIWYYDEAVKSIRYENEQLILTSFWEEGELNKIMVTMLANQMDKEGLHPFHSSSVVYRGHGILLVGGENNHGKSMTQLEGCRRGASIFSTETTVMDHETGIALYGYYPAPGLEGLDGSGLLPVMALKTRVAAVRAVPAGTCVSYGCTARLERDSRLAVLPVGYGDGYPRLLSNRMEVLLRGRRCPVVGRICMDMCMVDVTDVPDAVPGDVAELYGREGLLEQAAALAGTIPYELLCNVNPRVPRIYTGRGE